MFEISIYHGVYLKIILLYFRNMTSHIDEMRDVVYFDFDGFKDIYNCFVFYFNRSMGLDNKEKMTFDGQ